MTVTKDSILPTLHRLVAEVPGTLVFQGKLIHKLSFSTSTGKLAMINFKRKLIQLKMIIADGMFEFWDRESLPEVIAFQ